MKRFTNKAIGAVVGKHGVSFRVWAPFADSVSVTGTFNEWQLMPMKSEGNGYWYVVALHAQAGQEYKYVITNDGKTFIRNDPRSLLLTTTAGNSVIVDTTFDWGDVTYSPPPKDKIVLYEMHIGTFARDDPSSTGTFNDAIDKLDYLADLGVTMIELMPVATMSMKREWWGYTPEYIFAVERLYGGRHAMLEFVKEAHARGIGVILDVVYNHIGPDEQLDMWQFDGWSENDKGGIYFYNDWRSTTPWAETRPDYGREEVRQYILDNVKMWLTDFKLDGLRVDSTVFIRNAQGINDNPDTDISEGWLLLQHINKLAKKINPRSIIIAEDVGCNEYLTKPISEGGAGFDAQWEVTYPHHYRQVLDKTADYERDIQEMSTMLERRYSGDALQSVIYSDSHDSAANGGARLSESITPGNATSVYSRRRSLLAAGIILTSPGIPLLLQGQEFLQGGSFNDWEVLDWHNTDQFKGIVAAHKQLIELRKNSANTTAGLAGQNCKILHFDNDQKVLAYHRWDKGGPLDDVVIIVNFANKTYKTFDIQFPRDGKWQLRFNSDWQGYSPDFKNTPSSDVQVVNGVGTIIIGPYSVLVYS